MWVCWSLVEIVWLRLRVAHELGHYVMVEQPLNSVLFDYAPVRRLLLKMKAVAIKLPMGCYGARSEKPTLPLAKQTLYNINCMHYTCLLSKVVGDTSWNGGAGEECFEAPSEAFSALEGAGAPGDEAQQKCRG